MYWSNKLHGKVILLIKMLYSKRGPNLAYRLAIAKANAGVDLKRHSAPIFDAYNVTLIKQKLKAGQDLKLIRGNIDVDRWIEPKYVNNALKSQNLQNFWTPLNASGK